MSLIVVRFQITLPTSRPLEYTRAGAVSDGLPAHYHFHGPMAPLSTSTILRAFYNSQLGTSESKDLLGPRPSSRETFLGPGDAERVRFPTQRYVRLSRCFRKVFRPKKIPYPPVAPTAADRSESPLGCLPML